MSPETESITARIRAARAYANLSQPELAEAIEMSLPTYKRAELGKRPVSNAELIRIARACELPTHILTTDWLTGSPARQRANPDDIKGRLDAIEGRLDTIELTARRMVELAEAMVMRRGMPLAETPEDEPSSLIG